MEEEARREADAIRRALLEAEQELAESHDARTDRHAEAASSEPEPVRQAARAQAGADGLTSSPKDDVEPTRSATFEEDEEALRRVREQLEGDALREARAREAALANSPLRVDSGAADDAGGQPQGDAPDPPGPAAPSAAAREPEPREADEAALAAVQQEIEREQRRQADAAAQALARGEVRVEAPRPAPSQARTENDAPPRAEASTESDAEADEAALQAIREQLEQEARRGADDADNALRRAELRVSLAGHDEPAGAGDEPPERGAGGAGGDDGDNEDADDEGDEAADREHTGRNVETDEASELDARDREALERIQRQIEADAVREARAVEAALAGQHIAEDADSSGPGEDQDHEPTQDGGDEPSRGPRSPEPELEQADRDALAAIRREIEAERVPEATETVEPVEPEPRVEEASPAPDPAHETAREPVAVAPEDDDGEPTSTPPSREEDLAALEAIQHQIEQEALRQARAVEAALHAAGTELAPQPQDEPESAPPDFTPRPAADADAAGVEPERSKEPSPTSLADAHREASRVPEESPVPDGSPTDEEALAAIRADLDRQARDEAEAVAAALAAAERELEQAPEPEPVAPAKPSQTPPSPDAGQQAQEESPDAASEALEAQADEEALAAIQADLQRHAHDEAEAVAAALAAAERELEQAPEPEPVAPAKLAKTPPSPDAGPEPREEGQEPQEAISDAASEALQAQADEEALAAIQADIEREAREESEAIAAALAAAEQELAKPPKQDQLPIGPSRPARQRPQGSPKPDARAPPRREPERRPAPESTPAAPDREPDGDVEARDERALAALRRQLEEEERRAAEALAGALDEVGGALRGAAAEPDIQREVVRSRPQEPVDAAQARPDAAMVPGPGEAPRAEDHEEALKADQVALAEALAELEAAAADEARRIAAALDQTQSTLPPGEPAPEAGDEAAIAAALAEAEKEQRRQHEAVEATFDELGEDLSTEAPEDKPTQARPAWPVVAGTPLEDLEVPWAGTEPLEGLAQLDALRLRLPERPKAEPEDEPDIELEAPWQDELSRHVDAPGPVDHPIQIGDDIAQAFEEFDEDVHGLPEDLPEDLPDLPEPDEPTLAAAAKLLGIALEPEAPSPDLTRALTAEARGGPLETDDEAAIEAAVSAALAAMEAESAKLEAALGELEADLASRPQGVATPGAPPPSELEDAAALEAVHAELAAEAKAQAEAVPPELPTAMPSAEDLAIAAALQEELAAAQAREQQAIEAALEDLGASLVPEAKPASDLVTGREPEPIEGTPPETAAEPQPPGESDQGMPPMEAEAPLGPPVFEPLPEDMEALAALMESLEAAQREDRERLEAALGGVGEEMLAPGPPTPVRVRGRGLPEPDVTAREPQPEPEPEPEPAADEPEVAQPWVPDPQDVEALERIGAGLAEAARRDMDRLEAALQDVGVEMDRPAPSDRAVVAGTPVAAAPEPEIIAEVPQAAPDVPAEVAVDLPVKGEALSQPSQPAQPPEPTPEDIAALERLSIHLDGLLHGDRARVEAALEDVTETLAEETPEQTPTVPGQSVAEPGPAPMDEKAVEQIRAGLIAMERMQLDAVEHALADLGEELADRAVLERAVVGEPLPLAVGRAIVEQEPRPDFDFDFGLAPTPSPATSAPVIAAPEPGVPADAVPATVLPPWRRWLRREPAQRPRAREVPEWKARLPQPLVEQVQAVEATRLYRTLSIYLVLILLAELVTANWLGFGELPNNGIARIIGVVLHVLLAGALLGHGYVHIRDAQTPFGALLVAASLAPLTRLFSLSLPAVEFTFTQFYTLLSIPLYILLIGVMRSQQLGLGQVNLRLPRPSQFGLEIMVIVLSAIAGLIEYSLLRPDSRFGGLGLTAIAAPVLALLLITAFEEVLYRGILQRHAIRVFPPQVAIALISLLFASLQVGNESVGALLVAFIMGMVYGNVVLRTRSLVGVIIGHTLLNVIVFVIGPQLLA